MSQRNPTHPNRRRNLLIAFALATEWALAFAFAKHFARVAVAIEADALADIADANAQNANANELFDLQEQFKRHCRLAAGHAHGGAFPTTVEHGRERSTTVD